MSMGIFVLQLAILVLRGPHCPGNRWFGYEGGLGFRRTSPSDEPQSIVSSDPESVEGVAAFVEKRDQEKGAEELR